MAMKEPVYLRALEQDDLDRTHRWHNDPELYKFLGSAFLFTSRQVESYWLDQRSKVSDREINLAICVAESHEHVGNIYLRSIDWTARTAELHIFIGESDRQSSGYGSSALRQLLLYAFETLNLRKIHLRVLLDNGRAIRMYERVGFVIEGVLKSHVYKNGTYKDLALMALTRDSAGVADGP